MKTISGNIWTNGIMGVIIGDALGCPVQFRSREEISKNPVTGMTGYGTYHMPSGTWTDDGSMTLAALDSILENKCINPADIMYRFAAWLTKGEYTPFGKAFDNGGTTTDAIFQYIHNPDTSTCGGTGEHTNGNGSLMRIMPVCLFCCEMQAAEEMDDLRAISLIHEISGLTHNHMCSKVGCGLYYFLVRAILCGNGTLAERLQSGMDAGFAFYEKDTQAMKELARYERLRDLAIFKTVPEAEITSSGYVVDTLEAAVWSLLVTDSFRDALLTAVNLGDDTDTVGAVCGGLAGLFYGYENIPEEWLAVIKRRDWIEELCEKADAGKDSDGNNSDGRNSDEKKADGMNSGEKKAAVMGRTGRRKRNVAIFRDTVIECRDNPKLAESIMESTKGRRLFLEGDTLRPSSERYQKPVEIIVSGKRSFEAAAAYIGKKVCVLNFASSTNPGGGVKYGSSAQEESLCRCSTLYFVLDSPRMMSKFYLPHNKSNNTLYNDDIIYTPGITVFKSDTDFPEILPENGWYKVDVLTCAAPNLFDMTVTDSEPSEDPARFISRKELRKLLEKRVRRIFEAAAHEENEVLILGAFGCGAFRNPPDLMADVFREVTKEYAHRFETIEYAVFHTEKEEENYLAFLDAFSE